MLANQGEVATLQRWKDGLDVDTDTHTATVHVSADGNVHHVQKMLKPLSGWIIGIGELGTLALIRPLVIL